jgi:hypothetical protein
MTSAYVYGITVDEVLRYVGKGRRYRVREHYRIARLILRKRAVGKKIKSNRFYNRLAAAMSAGSRIDEVVYAQMLSDAEAFELERRLIAEAPVGQLWNTTAGGDGISSEEARARWTPERRAAHSERTRQRWADSAQRQAHSEAIKAQWADPAYREHHIAKQKERWGRPGAKERGSEIAKRMFEAPEARAALSAAQRAYWAKPENQEKLRERNRKVALSREANRKASA